MNRREALKWITAGIAATPMAALVLESKPVELPVKKEAEKVKPEQMKSPAPRKVTSAGGLIEGGTYKWDEYVLRYRYSKPNNLNAYSHRFICIGMTSKAGTARRDMYKEKNLSIGHSVILSDYDLHELLLIGLPYKMSTDEI